MIKKIVLKRPPQGSLRAGHAWIYKNQIKEVLGSTAPGDLVDVVTETNRLLGRGYWNPRSEISIRLLTRQDELIDNKFVRRALEKAVIFRERVVSDTNAYRVVSSEADALPGLVVDRYAEVLTVQFLTLGMDRMRDWVVDALNEVLPNRGIFERSDTSSRGLEGLEEKVGWLRKDCEDEAVVYEKDIEMALFFGLGHKTGFYLDQRENRFLLRNWQKSGRVLDAFCYEAGFGLHLAKAGCQVTSIDIQKESIQRAEEHRKRNHLQASQLELKVENAFEALKEYGRRKEMFDLVILDPPSFAKQKTALANALSGYKEIVIRSMKILKETGALAIFSCAYHVDENLLMQVCMHAAADCKKNLRVLKFLKQAGDHPISPFIPETYYLKGFLLEVSSSLI